MKKSMTQKEVEQVIKLLNSGRFHAECPNCMDEVNLKEAGLFHLDHFSSEAKDVYKEMVTVQKERRAYLKERRLKIPQKSEVGAKSVNLGFLLERLAPTLDGFKFNKNDCRSLFDPIDYVIFEGLSKKKSVSKILFVDIKSGGARLSKKQKQIKEAVENGKVKFKTYSHE